jgi:hypothetical protein
MIYCNLEYIQPKTNSKNLYFHASYVGRSRTQAKSRKLKCYKYSQVSEIVQVIVYSWCILKKELVD